MAQHYLLIPFSLVPKVNTFLGHGYHGHGTFALNGDHRGRGGGKAIIYPYLSVAETNQRWQPVFQWNINTNSNAFG